jgi:hypothetical protein
MPNLMTQSIYFAWKASQHAGFIIHEGSVSRDWGPHDNWHGTGIVERHHDFLDLRPSPCPPPLDCSTSGPVLPTIASDNCMAPLQSESNYKVALS